jgi:hypothetical protein
MAPPTERAAVLAVVEAGRVDSVSLAAARGPVQARAGPVDLEAGAALVPAAAPVAASPAVLVVEAAPVMERDQVSAQAQVRVALALAAGVAVPAVAVSVPAQELAVPAAVRVPASVAEAAQASVPLALLAARVRVVGAAKGPGARREEQARAALARDSAAVQASDLGLEVKAGREAVEPAQVLQAAAADPALATAADRVVVAARGPAPAADRVLASAVVAV